MKKVTTKIYLPITIFQARMRQMECDVALFLQSLRFGETEIGMVEFDKNENILEYMTELDSDAALQQLLGSIPHTTGSGTCIGCGIRGALKVGHHIR